MSFDQLVNPRWRLHFGQMTAAREHHQSRVRHCFGEQGGVCRGWRHAIIFALHTHDITGRRITTAISIPAAILMASISYFLIERRFLWIKDRRFSAIRLARQPSMPLH